MANWAPITRATPLAANPDKRFPLGVGEPASALAVGYVLMSELFVTAASARRRHLATARGKRQSHIAPDCWVKLPELDPTNRQQFW